MIGEKVKEIEMIMMRIEDIIIMKIEIDKRDQEVNKRIGGAKIKKNENMIMREEKIFRDVQTLTDMTDKTNRTGYTNEIE